MRNAYDRLYSYTLPKIIIMLFNHKITGIEGAMSIRIDHLQNKVPQTRLYTFLKKIKAHLCIKLKFDPVFTKSKSENPVKSFSLCKIIKQ